MYEEFYKLDRAPFDTTPDPTFFFMSDGHQEALAALVYGIDRRKGFISLIGEVGTGKTTVLRAYIESEHVKNTRIIYLFNPRVSYEDLLLMVLRELRVEIPEGETKRVDLLHRVLVNEYKNGHNVVLIVDEAQNIPPETLESMRMLSNLETSSEKLIQIVLSGQPELEGLLGSSRLRQLRQRIAVKVKLDPLSREEASEYVRYRLRRAGGEDNVFTKDAINWVVRYTGGNPRSINVLCDNALITGYGYQQFPISTPIIKEIAKDFDIEQWNSKTNSSSADWLRRAAMVLAVAGLAGFAYIMGTNKDAWPGGGDRVAEAVTTEQPADAAAKEINDSTVAIAKAEPAMASDVDRSDAKVEDASSVKLNVVDDSGAKPVFESVVKSIDTPDSEINDESLQQEPEVAESAPMAEVAENGGRNTDEVPTAVAGDVSEAANGVVTTDSNDGVALVDSTSTTTVRVARLQDSDSNTAIAPAVAVASNVAGTIVDEPVAKVASGSVLGADDSASTEDQTVVVIDGVRQLIPNSEIESTSELSSSVINTDGNGSSVATASLDTGGEVTGLSDSQTIVAEASVTNPVQQASRIVQNGDNLWDMAAEVYGRVDDNIVSRIIETNPELANPDSIYIGQKIIFPEL